MDNGDFIDRDEFAKRIFETIHEVLRSDPSTAALADEILNEINQGELERKEVKAPKYREQFEDRYIDATRGQRSSKQSVTIAVPLDSKGRARVALRALRRAFVEPGPLADHLSKSLAVPREAISPGAKAGSDPFHKIRTAEPIPLTLTDPRNDASYSLEQIQKAIRSDAVSFLDNTVKAIEERLA